MQITDNHVVSIAYTLKDEKGEILYKSDDGSFCYLHGASNIISGLENALSGKQAGDEMSVSINPEEGYGVRDDEKLQQVAREMFPPEQDIEAGMQFHAEGPDGQTIVVTVAAVEGDQVTIDGNHPLAGVQLNFDVKIMDIRDASSEELEHGHVHGPEGHAHD
jgi:FKBP-type peptidyl-prolyl cis-trans isomerase SlyD